MNKDLDPGLNDVSSWIYCYYEGSRKSTVSIFYSLYLIQRRFAQYLLGYYTQQSRRYIVPNIRKSFPNIRRMLQSVWF